MVSFCAFLRLHHFCAMIVSDQIDMIAKVMTMPQAKVPMSRARSSSDSSIVLQAPGGYVSGMVVSCLLGEREVERLLHELLHLAAADFRRIEAHVVERGLHRIGEELMARLEHLD